MSLCCCLNPGEEENIKYLDLLQKAEIPVKKRQQTDFHCFIILGVYFLFLAICVCVAGSQADIRRFFHGYDDRGNLCGVKNNPIEGVEHSGQDLTEKKFLQVTKRCNFDRCSIEIDCVDSCDDGYLYFMIPHCGLTEEKFDEKKLDEKNPFVDFNYYHGEDQDKTIETKGTQKSFFEIMFSDISLCWREIIVLCFCSIGLSGLIMTVLQMFPKVIIKTVIIISSLATIGWTVFFWIMVAIKGAKDPTIDSEPKIENKAKMADSLIAAVFLSVYTAIFFFMLFKMRNKIKLLAALFEEGGKCIKDIPTLFLLPVLNYLITAAFACFAFIGFVCFQTSDKAKIDDEGKVFYPVNVFFQITSWFLFFAFIWASQFFMACQNLVTAGAVSSWYFSRVKGELDSPVWRSSSMVFNHHLGSAAFGSLLVAIVRAFRYFARMLERNAREGGVAAVVFAIVYCLLTCLETILKMINKSAYVIIVLFGQPFCSSARTALACLTADSSKVGLITGSGSFILSSVQCIVTLSVTFFGVTLFMSIEGIQNAWNPAILVLVLSYMCCKCFFSIYDMAINTLIICFCVDHQMNNGLEKPYYMNQNLMILLDDDDRKKLGEIDPNGDRSMLVIA